MKSSLSLPYRFVVKAAKKITQFNSVFEENNFLKNEILRVQEENEKLHVDMREFEEDYNYGHPKGHFYSPVHSQKDLEFFNDVVKRSEGKFTQSIPGFSDKRMINEFNSMSRYFREFDYPSEFNGKSRFYTKNVSISMMDALVLFSMLRFKKPKRIIEIGSGFTSALMMDVNERYFNNSIKMTFIEPYPNLLMERMGIKDKDRCKVIAKGVQFVPLKVFRELGENDFLFIDSTHVSKFNSDVNYELFDILPELKSGVIIHFHDILNGFEYPLYWLEKGWAWNEAYLLRAFLTGNKDYEILLMTNYLSDKYPDLLKKSYPKDCVLNGGDLWLQKK